MTTCAGGASRSQWTAWLRYLAIVTMALAGGSQAMADQTSAAASKKSESSAVPRTPDGHADLQGTWNYGTEMPLQRPDDLAGKDHLTQEETAKYREQMATRRKARENGKPTRYSGEVFDDVLPKADWSKHTSLITDPPDGKIPPITPLAEKRRAEREAAFAKAEGPEDVGLADRCILGWSTGPPIIPGNQSNMVQLFQSRDHVVIYTEMIHDARIVPLNNAPIPGSAIHEYSGVSRGRWEKDTLVVETTNFTHVGIATLSLLRSGGTDENMQLVERFTRTGPKTLLYEFTITDPTTWTRPWSASVPMLKTDERIYEYACHEGNHSLETMLENARSKEKTDDGAAKKQPH